MTCSATKLQTSQRAYLAIEGSASTSIEAIKLCGKALEQAGYVTAAFAEDCIEREKSFPTGIEAEIPLALPHCFTQSILQSALCYLRLDKPVTFYRMDDDQETISTRHIFNLAIDRGDHLEFLSKLVGILQDKNHLLMLEQLSIEEAGIYLQKALEEHV